MFTQSGVVGRQLVPVESRRSRCDNRPRVRVGGRFAGEVARVELREGGVEVVGVERDLCRDPLVGVDLDDCRRFDVERLGLLVTASSTGTNEDEALPAGRNDV